MSSVTSVVSHYRTKAVPHAHPLLKVMAWELRRFRASRLTWVVPFVALGLFLFMMWANRGTSTVGEFTQPPLFQPPFSANLDYASPWRLTFDLPRSLLFLLAIALPFWCADGVARDLKRHTHELLMTTSLPTWAYVCGRYLVVLLLSLGLALELLAALLLMGQALHLMVGGETYPALQVGSMLAVWAALVVPTVLLVSSISFALGTLLPRRANLVKIGFLVIWLVGAVILPNAPELRDNPPAWYQNWDPTSGILAHAKGPYSSAFNNMLQSLIDRAVRTSHTSIGDQVRQAFFTAEYQLPDLWSWLLPHLVWAGLGLGLVLFASGSFQRFRNVSN